MIATPPSSAPHSSSAHLLHRVPALAGRLVREHAPLRPLLAWLAEPGSSQLPSPEYRHGELTTSMEELLQAIAADASPWERRQLDKGAEWLTAFAIYSHQSPSAVALGLSTRMVASCLLPLYRCLATNQLSVSLQAMRHRCTEHLVLHGLMQEFGPEFCESLAGQLSRGQVPTEILAEDYSIDSTQIALVLLDLIGEYDEIAARLSQAGQAMLRSFDPKAEAPLDNGQLDWAAPKLLWQLAGELIATRSEMVLPRPWIEVPIPWSKIQTHWHQVSRLLHQLHSPQADNEAVDANPRSEATGHQTQTAAAPDLSAEHLSSSEASRTNDTISPAAASPETIDTLIDGIEHAIESAADDRVDGSRHSHYRETAASRAEPTPAADHPAKTEPRAEPGLELALPKVILAEISSTSDPALMNVLKRKLSVCRVEDRQLCVSVVVVTPDDEQSTLPSVAGGLAHWQQQVVNWIAEQPHVVDPRAFLTSAGELILCIQDLEKNEISGLIRRALLLVLGGQPDALNSEATLSKVNIPARFHAGIAATSSPGPNLTPEQLIAPAIRCLDAAQHQGKAGIKSIEVY